MTRLDVRLPLGALLALVALNAFGGGVYGMAGAPDVPTTWLRGSPFSTYLVPSVVLFVVVGGTFAVAALAVIGRSPHARDAAYAAAFVALGWIGAQLAIIGFVSWLQPAIVAIAALVLVLAPRVA